MRLRQTFVALACLSAACCVASKPAPVSSPRVARPAPKPTPAPVPQPVATLSGWADAPQTSGDWRFARPSAGSAAHFGEIAGQPLFSIVCAPRSAMIELVRHGQFAADAPMTIRTEFATRALAGTGAAGDPALRTTLMPRDPLLDAMAFSKGRFAIETPGVAPLYIPSWPEVTRVIEDCR